MKEIKFTIVTFEPKEKETKNILGFRGFIINFTKNLMDDNSIFHNHKTDTQYLYRYPLVQYKIINNSYVLYLLEEATAYSHLFANIKEIAIETKKVKVKTLIESFTQKCGITDDMVSYQSETLWFPIKDSDKLKEYKLISTNIEKREYLMRILKNNIVTLAKALGLELTRQILIENFVCNKQKTYNTKLKSYVYTYHILFTTNILLPNYVGIGNNPALGNGSLKIDEIFPPDNL